MLVRQIKVVLMCSMELNVNQVADACYTKALQFTGSTGRKKNAHLKLPI